MGKTVKQILLSGPVDAATQNLIQTLSRQATTHLTVYTPSRVTLPTNVTALTAEPLDEGGLSAAMVGQDLVVALAPTIHLLPTVQTVVTAAQATAVPQVIVSRTDDLDALVGQRRQARQLLAASGLAYDLLEGYAGVAALLGGLPTPVAEGPRILPFEKTV